MKLSNLKAFFVSALLCFTLSSFAQTTETKVQETPQDTSFVVETLNEKPVFRGNLSKYISLKIKYPQSSIDNEEEGKTIVSFVVEKDGSVNNVEVVKSSGYAALDKEAVRVVSNMPNWTPGMMDNKPVRMQFRLPINFKLE